MTFDDIIYLQLSTIPFGQAVSYGYLARMAGFKSHARQVGRTLKKLPKDTQLPWHRVVNSQGKISLPPDSNSYQEQIKRLQSEGITLQNGRIAKGCFLG